MFKRILVATDGSPTANRGLKAAMELAVDQRATVFPLYVVDDMAVTPKLATGLVPAAYFASYSNGMRRKGHAVLARAETFAQSCGVACKPVLVETLGQAVAQTILQQARTLDADVIVLGTHGRRGLRRLILGSDAEAVLREAEVPVLLVRGPHPAARHRRTRAVGVPAPRAAKTPARKPSATR